MGYVANGELMNADQQRQYWLSERHLDYHRRQFAEPYRSTVRLGQFVRDTLGDCTVPYQALDVGCGSGANIYHLAQMLPNTSWVGFDMNESLFDLGNELIDERGGLSNPVQFMAGDFYRLEEHLLVRSFDLVFSIQTLSWLPEYEKPLSQLLSMLRRDGGAAFITSLFTDSMVDARIEITQYHEGKFEEGEGPAFYNVYCLERFREICLRQGASEVVAIDFEMDVDIPIPSTRDMGTYTRKMADGHRLQVSGPLLMPWKFVAVRMAET